MNIRSFAVNAALSAVIAGSGLAVSLPAFAQPVAALDSCSGAAQTCTYVNAGYSVLLGSRTTGVPLENISTANRNKLSSWVNYTYTNARFYYNVNGGGHCVQMQNRNMASANASNPDNDQAESWAFNAAC